VKHPRSELDELIHQPVRFSIVAALDAADEVVFAVLRDAVGVSDSVLSHQISTLEEAGYVMVRKGHVGKRPRTWLSLSPAGREAFHRHLGALRQIVAHVPGALT
jgi:DNA-binding MarR family transcriptional regulator